MNVPIAGPEGNEWVPEEDLTEAELSIIGSHQNAIEAFLSGRDPTGSGLLDYEGRIIRGIALVTDLERILDLAGEDRLGFENFYQP